MKVHRCLHTRANDEVSILNADPTIAIRLPTPSLKNVRRILLFLPEHHAANIIEHRVLAPTIHDVQRRRRILRLDDAHAAIRAHINADLKRRRTRRRGIRATPQEEDAHGAQCNSSLIVFHAAGFRAKRNAATNTGTTAHSVSDPAAIHGNAVGSLSITY